MKPGIRARLQPHAFKLDAKRGLAKIAYPLELFEPSSVPQILSSVAGNIYGMKALKNLRLLDLRLPKEVVRAHPGPKHGIAGVRKVLKVKKRPLVGTIVKPKVGLNPREHAKVAYDAWVGGCDIVKDDENLTNQKFNAFNPRVKATLRARDKAEAETGERKVYMANVTAEACEMLSRLDYVKSLGGRYVMVDIVTVGFSGLQTLRANSRGLVLHAHRAMHAAFTRNPRHGLSMLALAKLTRLVGLDQLHIGTIVGKMHGGRREVVEIKEEMSQKKVSETPSRLAQDWQDAKPVFPVCSGGLHAGHVEPITSILGTDVILQAGGGVHGHPDGTVAGATSMRQAVDAVMAGETLANYARTHAELGRVVEAWGGKK